MWGATTRLHLCREGEASSFGFVALPTPDPSLAVVRDLILAELSDAAPLSFAFLLPGSAGVPVSRVQEHAHAAADFL